MRRLSGVTRQESNAVLVFEVLGPCVTAGEGPARSGESLLRAGRGGPTIRGHWTPSWKRPSTGN